MNDVLPGLSIYTSLLCGESTGAPSRPADTHRPAANTIHLDTGGTGEPVLLMTATASGDVHRRDQIEMLVRQGYRVLLYPVGTRWSAQSGNAIGTALQHHGVPRAHLVAQGCAALQAWELAASHAHRFRSLSVVGAGHVHAMVDHLLAGHPLCGLERWPAVLSRVLGHRLRRVVKAQSGGPGRPAASREIGPDEIAGWADQLASIKAVRQPIRPIAVPTLAVHVENNGLSCERALLHSGLRVTAEWRFERLCAGPGPASALQRSVNELLRRWFAATRDA